MYTCLWHSSQMKSPQKRVLNGCADGIQLCVRNGHAHGTEYHLNNCIRAMLGKLLPYRKSVN